MTNDVSSQWLTMGQKKRPIPQNLFWCERSFAKAISKISPSFFHPSAPIIWQHASLGLPPILTGGEGDDDVGRAIVIIADGHYRILEISVGIPDNDELSELIADAEETRMLLRRHASDPTMLINAIADRNRRKLGRIWQLALDKQLELMGQEVDAESFDPLVQNNEFTSKAHLRLGMIATQLQSVYEKDVSLRFAVDDPSQWKRLAILEQHSATRRPWSLCIHPFLVGADARLLYTDVAEIVWDRRVISEDEGDDDEPMIERWITGHDDSQPFVLQIPQPLLSARSPPELARVSEVARRKGLGWDDLDATLNAGLLCQVSTRELARWLYQEGRRPIDLRRPSPARYLFFRSAKSLPFPIRDGEPPGRSITMIRQVQK